MKRILSILMILGFCFTVAQASEPSFALSINGENVTFGMSDQELTTLYPDVYWDPWFEEDPHSGTLIFSGGATEIDTLTATDVTLQVDRNNSLGQPKLTLVSASLPTGDNCISAFKDALAVLTQQHGQPDYDPFGMECVRIYQANGTLSATWTTDEVTISLSLNRMFDENLSLDYMYLLNYDAGDLN